tara:strand:+ start:253 stop:471 length:219 start_codon:yes stop_codon:yes gene_type:complete
MAKENKRKRVVICPFAHLSNNLADSKESIKFFNLIEKELSKKINTTRSLLVLIKMHYLNGMAIRMLLSIGNT